MLVRTEVSLISAGTELTNLLGDREDQPFPKYPGYSNVGVVEAVGDQVADFAVGDRVLSNGRHASHHIVSRATKRTGAPQTLLRVPEGSRPGGRDVHHAWGQWRCTAFAKRSPNSGKPLPWWGKEWWGNSFASSCD